MRILFAALAGSSVLCAACHEDHEPARSAPDMHEHQDAGEGDAGPVNEPPSALCGKLGQLCCEAADCDAPNECVRGRCHPPEPQPDCHEGSVEDCCGVACTSDDATAVVACLEGACRTARHLVAAGTTLSTIAVDDDSVFYTAYSDDDFSVHLMRASLEADGSAPTEILRLSGMGQIALEGTDVYVADFSEGVVRVPKAGGAITRLVGGHDDTYALTIVDGFAYFSTGGGTSYPQAHTGLVLRTPLDGTGPVETLAFGIGSPGGIAVSAGQLFWTDSSSEQPGSVWSRSLAGGEPVRIATWQYRPLNVQADETHLYWVNFARGDVLRMPITGGNVELLSAGLADEFLTQDDKAVYWSEDLYAQPRRVRRFTKATGAISTLAATDADLGALTVHGESVYWLQGDGVWATTR
jgi:hypothetical protein